MKRSDTTDSGVRRRFWFKGRPTPHPRPQNENRFESESGFDDMGRYGHGHCADCQSDNTSWYTDTSLWHAVMGEGPVFGAPGEGICPSCFTARAAALGIAPPSWRLSAQWSHALGGAPSCPEKGYKPRHAAP